MNDDVFSDEKLNLFIDEQLAKDEMDHLRHAMLEDNELRGRVCQLKAIRELVSYAYENTPEPASVETAESGAYLKRSLQGVAAGLIIGLSALSGWFANDQVRANTTIASTTEVFQYFKHNLPVDRLERKIILHVTTGDIAAINAALNEAEQLLESYRAADTPMKLDIVTYREGINMMRLGVSPYIQRLDSIAERNDNVQLYACQRSIAKAREKETRDVVLMPEAIVNRSAMDLISERIEEGWIYIKV